MSSRPVRTRRVFYIPGFDPFPARRYRELYRSEAARQAEISEYEIEVAGEDAGWRTRARMGGTETVAHLEVLGWSDIVRDTMRPTVAAGYAALVWTVWVYLSTGVLQRLTWLRKGPVLAAFYPVALLLGQGLVAIAAAWLAGSVAGWVHPVVGWVVALPVAVVVLRGFRRIDGRLYAHYLMHDYAFTASEHGAYPDALERRLRSFRDRVAEALQSDADEVLVVGHSSGAHLAVSLVADLARGGLRPNGPALALLTLGEVIPMVSFLPRATRLRADLRHLSGEARVAWVDVTAPGDGCCFALCDPVAVTGVAAVPKRWPLVISAAFSQSLSEEMQKRLRHRYFRLHFQYICAFDRPRDYDYFAITAGPVSLADRYRDRGPSRSRIDVAASRYRSVA